MLGELDVEPVFTQAENFDAVRAQRFGHAHTQFGRPSLSYVQHHDRDRDGLFTGFGNPPDTAICMVVTLLESPIFSLNVEPLQCQMRKVSGHARESRLLAEDPEGSRQVAGLPCSGSAC